MSQTRSNVDSSATAPARSGWSRFKFDREFIIELGLRYLPAFDRLLMRFAATPDHQVFPRETFP